MNCSKIVTLRNILEIFKLIYIRLSFIILSIHNDDALPILLKSDQ